MEDMPWQEVCLPSAHSFSLWSSTVLFYENFRKLKILEWLHYQYSSLRCCQVRLFKRRESFTGLLTLQSLQARVQRLKSVLRYLFHFSCDSQNVTILCSSIMMQFYWRSFPLLSPLLFLRQEQSHICFGLISPLHTFSTFIQLPLLLVLLHDRKNIILHCHDKIDQHLMLFTLMPPEVIQGILSVSAFNFIILEATVGRFMARCNRHETFSKLGRCEKASW